MGVSLSAPDACALPGDTPITHVFSLGSGENHFLRCIASVIVVSDRKPTHSIFKTLPTADHESEDPTTHANLQRTQAFVVAR